MAIDYNPTGKTIQEIILHVQYLENKTALLEDGLRELLGIQRNASVLINLMAETLSAGGILNAEEIKSKFDDKVKENYELSIKRAKELQIEMRLETIMNSDNFASS